jgi:hypothetical protein
MEQLVYENPSHAQAFEVLLSTLFSTDIFVINHNNSPAKPPCTFRSSSLASAPRLEALKQLLLPKRNRSRKP